MVQFYRAWRAGTCPIAVDSMSDNQPMPTRRVRYCVAASLDGFIAGPNGEVDWILSDPTFDFNALYNQFGVALFGRHTYEWMVKHGEGYWPKMDTYVFSRTLQPTGHPNVTILSTPPEHTVAELRQQPGKDIWLFGGGQLFRSLADAGMVDTVEVAVMPALLGNGIPLLPPPYGTIKLALTKQETSGAGIVSLHYDVKHENTSR